MPKQVITRLWPPPAAGGPMEDPALIEAYTPPDGPWLRVNFVTSIDGAVELDGYSEGLSGPADKRVFGLLRMMCDALLVGAGTLRHEGYHAVRLNDQRRSWRRANGYAEYPTLVVVSNRLDLDPGQSAFAEAPVRPIVLTSRRGAAEHGREMAAVAEVIPLGEQDTDLAAGLKLLGERGLRRVLSEGGPHLFGALAAADLVDEVCLTVSPQLAGPGAGRITAGPPSPPRGMSLCQVLTADGNLLLRYARP